MKIFWNSKQKSRANIFLPSFKAMKNAFRLLGILRALSNVLRLFVAVLWQHSQQKFLVDVRGWNSNSTWQMLSFDFGRVLSQREDEKCHQFLFRQWRPHLRFKLAGKRITRHLDPTGTLIREDAWLSLSAANGHTLRICAALKLNFSWIIITTWNSENPWVCMKLHKFATMNYPLRNYCVDMFYC